MEVRRASHSHHVPHVARPQAMPVSSVTAVKAVAISAADDATRSHHSVRRFSHTALATVVTRQPR